MSTANTGMLAAALEYAAHRDPVFPAWHAEGDRCGCRAYDCMNPAKHPIGSCAPNGHRDATTDTAVIERWFAQFSGVNVAMRTGITSTVLDVDPAKGGAETLARLAAKHGPLPATAKVLTGGGGFHLHFAPVPGLRNRAGKIGPGLDVRGEGGYVLLPPSNHVSGGYYGDDPDAPMYDTPCAQMPAWLVALAATSSSNGAGSSAPDRTPHEWAQMLTGAPEGQRHAVALKIAGHYLGLGLAESEVLTILLLYAGQCTPPFPEREARELVRDLARKDRAESGTDWPLYDGAAQWEFPAIAEFIDGLLPATGIVWWGGLPKPP